MTFLAPLYLLLGVAAGVPLLLHLLRRNIAHARGLSGGAISPARGAGAQPLAAHSQPAADAAARAARARARHRRGAAIRAPGFGVGHGPTAVAVVLDNSLSTTAVTDGAPVFNKLRDAARSALVAQHAGATSSGSSPPTATCAAARAKRSLAELDAHQRRRGARAIFRSRCAARRRRCRAAALPARVVAVATDGQRTAWASATSRRRSRHACSFRAATRRAIAPCCRVDADPARWTPRGSITSRIDAADSVGYRVVLGDAHARARRGRRAASRCSSTSRRPSADGRRCASSSSPTTIAADDARYSPPCGSVRRPASRVDPSAGPFAATAVSTLVADGRAAAGPRRAHRVGRRGGRAPRAHHAAHRRRAARRRQSRARAARRAVALRRAATARPRIARGAQLDGVEHHRRATSSCAKAPAQPTRSPPPRASRGSSPVPGYVLIASRLDPAATTLPVRAAFVPWLADMIGLRLGAPTGDVGAPIDRGARGTDSLSRWRRRARERRGHAPLRERRRRDCAGGARCMVRASRRAAHRRASS